jgi:glutathione S-transferase
MFLTERGVKFHRVEVEMASKEHQRAPYTTEVNPNATVPAMFDADVHLGDSLAIMSYIDAHASGNRLFPDDGEKLAEILSWIERADTDFWDVSHHLYWQIIEPPTGGADETEIARLLAKGHALLTQLDYVLANQPYITGDSLTAADIAVFPWVYGYKRFDLFDNETAYSHVRAWRDSLIARKSFTLNYKVPGEALSEFLARFVVR